MGQVKKLLGMYVPPDEFNNGGEWFNCCTQQLVAPARTREITEVDA